MCACVCECESSVWFVKCRSQLETRIGLVQLHFNLSLNFTCQSALTFDPVYLAVVLVNNFILVKWFLVCLVHFNIFVSLWIVSDGTTRFEMKAQLFVLFVKLKFCGLISFFNLPAMSFLHCHYLTAAVVS